LRSGEEYSPFTLVVDDEFEDTMSVGCAEGDGVFSRCTAHRGKRCTNVGVKHRKLELQICQAGVRLPSALFRVILGDISAIDELIICGVKFARSSNINTVMFGLIDAKHEGFLECP